MAKMCGIFGYYMVREPRSEDGWNGWEAWVHAAAEAMETRGTDSWGWVGTSEGAVLHARGLGRITKGGRAAIPPVGCRSVVAHTRAATMGEVARRNSHPFFVGSVACVHNGMIWNHDEVDWYGMYEVDSQALVDRIAAGQTVSDLDGYGAVSWIDTDPRKPQTYLARMQGGELDAAMLRLDGGGRVIVWASNMTRVRTELSFMGWPVGMVRDLPELVEGTVYAVQGGHLRRTQRRLDLAPWAPRSYFRGGWSFSSEPPRHTALTPVVTGPKSAEDSLPVAVADSTELCTCLREESYCSPDLCPHEPIEEDIERSVYFQFGEEDIRIDVIAEVGGKAYIEVYSDGSYLSTAEVSDSGIQYYDAVELDELTDLNKRIQHAVLK